MYRRKIVGLLLLAAFIVPVGFKGLVYAGESDPSVTLTTLSDKLDGIQALLDQLKEQIQPTWSKVLPPYEERFKAVMNGEAVLDKKTGLVWEKSPNYTDTMTWTEAIAYADKKELGGCSEWRLPTIEELASLGNSLQVKPPFTPYGHQPFTNVQSSFYWSATTIADGTSYAEFAHFPSGHVFDGDKSITNFGCCVRGGN